jgi:hypothetical protein
VRYRLRTESEFLRDFGSDWRGIGATWDEEMDIYFGRSLTKEEYESDDLVIDGWFFSKGMRVAVNKKFEAHKKRLLS